MSDTPEKRVAHLAKLFAPLGDFITRTSGQIDELQLKSNDHAVKIETNRKISRGLDSRLDSLEKSVHDLREKVADLEQRNTIQGPKPVQPIQICPVCDKAITPIQSVYKTAGKAWRLHCVPNKAPGQVGTGASREPLCKYCAKPVDKRNSYMPANGDAWHWDCHNDACQPDTDNEGNPIPQDLLKTEMPEDFRRAAIEVMDACYTAKAWFDQYAVPYDAAAVVAATRLILNREQDILEAREKL